MTDEKLVWHVLGKEPMKYGQHHKLEEARKDPPLETSGRPEAPRQFDCRSLASGTVREYI
jgi:hypothetical protein